MTQRSTSVAETEQIASELAAGLRGGEVIVLTGELGAGKTQFVRGIVAGLGGPIRRVCSPTFMLLNIYEGGRLRVFHLDAYRVAGAEDFEGIGFTELLEQGGVVAVEWGSRVQSLLPEKRIEVTLTAEDADSRIIQIEYCGQT